MEKMFQVGIARTLRVVALALLGAAALGVSGTAQADPPGDTALAAVDEAMNRADTHYFEFHVVNKEPGKDEQALDLIVKLKGQRRYTEFVGPADVKGTKVLVKSPTEMYTYLPAFNKVRRVASGVGDQGFMGMTFSQDDLRTSYHDAYTASVLSDDGTTMVISATAKPNAGAAYSRIDFTVAKSGQFAMLPTKIDYYNSAGIKVKNETRTGYSCQGNICTAAEQKMTQLTDGHWTKMIRGKWVVNDSTITEDQFSQRVLKQ